MKPPAGLPWNVTDDDRAKQFWHVFICDVSVCFFVPYARPQVLSRSGPNLARGIVIRSGWSLGEG